MANLALVFDVLAKDQASPTFRNVGDAAERAGKQTSGFGSSMASGMKLAAASLLGAGLIEGFKSLYQAADESRKIAALTSQVIKSTGGAAQVSAKQVGDLAAQIAKKTGVDDEAIQSGQNLLLTFTNIKNQAGAGNDIFSQTTKIMTDMSVALGTDASGSAIQLGKALNDPIKGVTALTRVGVSFTEQQKEQIRTLVESGDILGAQKVILAELGKEFGGAAEAASTPLGKLQQRLGDVAEQVGGYLIPLVDKAATFFNDKLLPAFSDIGSLVAGVAVPAFKAIATVVGAVADVFNALPGPLQAAVVAIGAFQFLKGPVGGALETIGLKALYMKDGIANAVTGVGGFKAAGAGLMGFLGGPWGLALAGATAGVTLLTSWLGKSSDASSDAAAFQRDLASALRESKGAIDANVRATAAQAAADKEVGDSDLLEVADQLGFSLPRLTDALTGNKNAYDALAGAANAYIDEALLSENAGDLGFTENAEKARLFLAALDELAPTMGNTVAENGRVAAATAETGAAMGASTVDTEEATAALERWLQQLQGIGEGFIQPLSVYQDLLSAKQEAERTSAEATAAATESSSDSWRDYVGDVSLSLDEYATKLQEQLTAQANWRTNIVTITQAGGLEVGQQLAAMGIEGAGLVQQMVDAIGTDQFPRLRDLMIQEAAAGGAGAAAALDNEMKVMAAISEAGGKATVTGLATQLGVGIAQIQDIAARYGITLASGINPILTSLGKQPIAGVGGRLGGFNEADGGIVSYFANGGMENHVAQIAPAGSWRVWAEPETGGEAYIPLSPAKRERSVNIWQETGKRLGLDFSMYANGGFASAADVPSPPSTAPYRMPISTAGDAAMDTAFKATADWMREGGPYANAISWAKSQVGKPYIWGGVGPAGYDCSGFMSAITNVLLGKSPHSRVGATASFPWPGFVSGDGAFTIGSTKDAGGGIGHMAGTLFGVNVESRGGQGVVVGGSARGAHNSLFGTRAHLAMYGGGVIGEPVSGIGHYSGRSYSFGERGPETVTPGLPSGGPVEITGTLAIGGDGLARIIDGRIVARDGRSSVNARSSR